MKRKLFNRGRLLTALLGFGLAMVAQAQTGEFVVPAVDRSCDKQVDEMATALRKNPKSLHDEVTKRVGAFPWCACPLTKTAIQSLDASSKLVGEIVFAATTAAPEQYEEIATCALEVAPDAAEEIRAALLKAFGENSDEQMGSGKGKSVAVKNPKGPGVVVEPPTTTLPARPGGFIDNIFIIPPAGFSTTLVSNPPTEDPPVSPPPTTPPVSPPPTGTDSNPCSAINPAR